MLSHTRSDERRAANQKYWEKQRRVQLEDYSLRSQDPTRQPSSIALEHLLGYAGGFIREAFFLLMCNCEKEATDLIEAAELTANRALRLACPDKIFISEIRHESPYREMESVAGRMKALDWLHYAEWFRTGERPLEILTDIAYLRRQYYDLTQSYKKDILDDVMIACVQAEQFQATVHLFQMEWPERMTRPKTMQFQRSQVRTLAVLAEYLAGDGSYRTLAEGAVNYWLQKSSNWSQLDADLPWWRKLSWAYLRTRHFGTDYSLSSILQDLRGY